MLHRRTLLFLIAITSALAGAGLSAQDAPRGGEKRRFANDFPVPPLVPYGSSIGPAPYRPWYPGFYETPWYIPQTRKYKFPAPVYEFPKLGLQYNYPYAYQFGLQMPPETDEPVLDVGHGIYPDDHAAQALAEGEALMRKGMYAEAGRRFARELRDDATPPEVYLHIAEAFFALGKYEDAKIVLMQAIDSSKDLDFLARENIADDFPSPDVLKKKLDEMGPNPPLLLRGTFRILAGEGEKGLEDLRAIQDKVPAAQKVYLRFLGAAFTPPPEKKESQPPPADKKAAKDEKSF